MKDGRQIKGLVVEQHEDRVVINVERVETPVMRDKIQEIVFDAPEQSLLQMGESLEKSEHWDEAMAAYEKALKIRPNFEEAKKAVLRVRNHSWSKKAIGPDDEIEKRQSLYESWGKVDPTQKKPKNEERAAQADQILKNFGLTFFQTGDWVFVDSVTPNKDAAVAGLKKADRLVEIDGRSLRYLPLEVVEKDFLTPRYADFLLEFDRNTYLSVTGFEKDVVELGMRVTLESRGLMVKAVDADSPADKAGIRENDLLVYVNGISTRYLSLGKLIETLRSGSADTSIVCLRRRVTLSRR